MSAETTIFTQDRLFTALQGAAFAEASALVRALTQAADPVALHGLQDQPVTVRGLSADAPQAVFQPIRLSVDNVVFLAQQAFGVNPRGFFVRPLFDPLLNAVRQRPPPLQNLVADALRQALFALQETLDLILAGAPPRRQPPAGPTLRFSDFTQRPSEFRAFGAAFAGVAPDAALNLQFAQRVGVASGGSVALGDLIQFPGAGSASDIAISLTGERGGGPLGEIRDGSGAPIADLSTVAFADLADLTYFAPATGVGLDNISFIALNDANDDGTFDGRGAFQTTVVSFAGAPQARREGDERIRDFFFGAESGTAQTRIALDL